MIPLREVLLVAIWTATFPKRHITWRGNRVRVSAGTRLYMETLPAPARALFVEDRNGRVVTAQPVSEI
ncbi:MAG TPA: hypothetical protein VK550_23500 [Polyangiaceae bacterium]|nr:hypothetical protein [Polyangiaceae bacterium]